MSEDKTKIYDRGDIAVAGILGGFIGFCVLLIMYAFGSYMIYQSKFEQAQIDYSRECHSTINGVTVIGVNPIDGNRILWCLKDGKLAFPKTDQVPN